MSRHPSSIPVRDSPPEWVPMLPREVEKKVLDLAKEGMAPARIGLTLRDTYGIPSVHELTGKKIGAILAAGGIEEKVPHDLQNLIGRAINLQEHVEKNHKDLHNRRGLEMIEARIRRLARYHKDHGNLPEDWKYTREGARLLVD